MHSEHLQAGGRGLLRVTDTSIAIVLTALSFMSKKGTLTCCSCRRGIPKYYKPLALYTLYYITNQIPTCLGRLNETGTVSERNRKIYSTDLVMQTHPATNMALWLKNIIKGSVGIHTFCHVLQSFLILYMYCTLLFIITNLYKVPCQLLDVHFLPKTFRCVPVFQVKLCTFSKIPQVT